MPTFAVALALSTALAGADASARHDGLLTRVQASQTPAAAAPVAAPPQAAMPVAQTPMPGQAAAPTVIYQGPPGQALSDPAIEARINAQIEALLVPPNGGFTVQRYAKPDNGNGNGGFGGTPGLAARNGFGASPSGPGGGGGGGGSGSPQQAGYPNGGSGGGFGGGQGGASGQGGFGGQGGGQGGGGQFGGGGQGQQGGYPAQANFQGQQGGFGGGGGQGGFGGGQGGGSQGPGGFGQNGGGQNGFNGYGQGGQFGPPPVKRYAVARAGDTVYATLDQGYNSDDPQAPIFATIYDVDSAQQPGPLNGVRLIGQIVYSTNQAAIQFTQMVLVDGRQFPLKAYAISARDARTGVSDDVDEHTFERYAGLFAATLIQGAGQAGQLLLQTNRSVVIDPATGLAISAPGGNVRTQAALAALMPLGQAATAIGAQNFNKPATIAGAPGFGIGVVFLEPPALPRDAIYVGSGGAVYRGGRVVSRLN